MEQIYTIPVNEAFDKVRDEQNMCPFCLLYNRLEANELDLILGASAMEPDVRIKTNELGFCRNHYADMLAMNNRLSLALTIESRSCLGVDPVSSKNGISSFSRSSFSKASMEVN